MISATRASGPAALGLGLGPTPFHPLPRLSAHLGGPPIFAKRDDLSGLGAGGNKARKLRRILADALVQRASVILTQGGPQSNHCSQAALAAAMAGLRCELFIWGDDPGSRTGNLRVEGLVDAHIHFMGSRIAAEVDAVIAERARQLVATGERPYVIGIGGSDLLGVEGASTVVDELEIETAELEPPMRVVVAAGSMGTMAGLVLGSWRVDRPWLIDGYTVFMPEQDARSRLEVLLSAGHATICPTREPRANYALLPDQLGGGYSQPTVAGIDAQLLAARLEGLILDSTYTAKAMAGLVDGVRNGRYSSDGSIVFWHTGGLAGFFR